MPEDSLVHNKDTFKRNVPIATNENVPLSELGLSTCRGRKSIPKRKIEELAIEKYRTTGEGIVFTDITRTFSCSKNKAQRILKDCCNIRRPLLFRSLNRTSPQRYFPTCIRADIIEHLKKKENVLKDPTEVSSSSNALSYALVQQKSQHILDVLTNLQFAPFCIHKLQLQLDIVPEGYDDTNLGSQTKNKAKVHEERIGQVKSSPNVKYYLYPKGKIMVYIICSDRPFKLETDNDVSSLFAFFGQVRDRLLYLLSDVRERIAHQHCSLQMSYKRIGLYDACMILYQRKWYALYSASAFRPFPLLRNLFEFYLHIYQMYLFRRYHCIHIIASILQS